MSGAGELVERTFEVDVPSVQAWQMLADVARWPEWAPHILSASVDPPGPVGPTSKGVFRFRPFGTAAFEMTAWDPPWSWTWTGRVIGVTICYDHEFEPINDSRSRLRWVVRTGSGRRGVRGQIVRRDLFATHRPSLAGIRPLGRAARPALNRHSHGDQLITRRHNTTTERPRPT